jgi:hypothetical protein
LKFQGGGTDMGAGNQALGRRHGPPTTARIEQWVKEVSFHRSTSTPAIEEQDDHLVLAIRVPKATIVSNLPVFAALAARCGVAIPRLWSTRDDPPLMSDHRKAYAAMEKAEKDYNDDAEEREEGPLADRMHEAWQCERQAFADMVSTQPRTYNERLALIDYVDEVAMRQEAKGAWDGGREILAANLREFAAVRVGSVD